MLTAGGHPKTFGALASIWRNFGNEITEEQFITLANEYNSRCEPPWSAKELQHKIDDVFKKIKTNPAPKSTARRNNPPTVQKLTAPKPDANASTTKKNILGYSGKSACRYVEMHCTARA